jgi:hypothetical protein
MRCFLLKLLISLLPPSVHTGNCTKHLLSGSCSCTDLKKTSMWRHITQDAWRHVFYYQCTKHHFTDVWRHLFYARLHDVTSQMTCDAVYSRSDYMTSLHRHVTPCILPDMTSHEGYVTSCVLPPTTWRHFTGDSDAVYSTRHDVHYRVYDVMCSTPD